jgi:hypothetical protein
MYSIFHYQETVVVARIAVHTHTHSETTKRRKKKKRKPKGSPGEVGGWNFFFLTSAGGLGLSSYKLYMSPLSRSNE